jgi:signal transduction histidine kinase
VQNSHIVLIIADDAAFPRDVLGRWQTERIVPGFTVMSTELFHGAAVGEFDVAIIGPVRAGRLASILKSMDTGSHPVICVLPTASQLQSVRMEHPRPLLVQQHEGWLDTLVLVVSECLKRVDMVVRVRKAEQAAAMNARNAALGRYMLDNRHGFNNLLTTMLGNSELLLMEGNNLAETARDQVETIHKMALHMHEIMQRFSSIAVEMQVAEKQSQDETEKLSHMTASNS